MPDATHKPAARERCDDMTNERVDRAAFERSISEFGLSLRGENALRQAGIRTLEDVLDWTELKLRSLRNCGPVTVRRLKTIVEDSGYSLACDTPGERASEHKSSISLFRSDPSEQSKRSALGAAHVDRRN